ncbi:MAG: spore germination protein, partial [Clostridia bacterium]|nr:spore germination protein [Clostridia bacterium]
LRKRLKTSDLAVEEIVLGEKMNSKIAVAYLKSVADEKIAQTVKAKLQEIEIDGVLDSSYSSKMLEEKPYSLFKQIGNSEKPDVITNKLLDGKIAVLCDGSPIVLYMPFVLIEDFEDVQDAYKRPLRATFLRYIRLLGAFLALLLPAVFVAVQVYQFQLLPVELLSTVVNSTGKIPFSPMLEMLVALLLFEILGEASIRMPRHVGLALGVVGAIVLGETAVQAGILSSLTVLVVAMSGIGLYSVPDEAGTLGVLRVLFVIISGLLGLIGLLLMGMAILAYMTAMSSFGIPYLMPLAPIFKEDLKDAVVKRNLTDLKRRFASFALKNKNRVKR